MRGTIFITLGLAAVLAHGACGDDTGTGGTGGTGGTNTGVGDGGTETTALAVTVEDEEGTPIAGATCAVQIANGTPVEATTGADGVAAFDLEGWTEPASVSCAMINVTALLGLLPEDVSDGELTLALETLAPPISPPEMVQVTGSILNPVQTGSDHHFFGVSHAYEMGTWEGSATSYFLSVPKGVPFDLLGYEVTYTNPPAQTMNQTFLAWTVVHHDGLDQNGTLDVDLGATVQPLTAAGTLARPTRADSPFTQDDARMVMHVLDRKETRYVGFGTSTAFTNDGRASYTSESVDSFLTPEQVVTTFQLKTNSYARSFVTLDGYPPSGDLETAFLDAPKVLAPVALVELEGAMVAWDPAAPSPNVIRVTDEAGHSISYYLSEGMTEAELPLLPSAGVDIARDDVLTAAVVHALAEPGSNEANRVAYDQPLSFIVSSE